MSKVIEFPSASVRNDVEIERGFREGLAGHGFSEDAVEAALKVVMPLMLEANKATAKDLGFSLNASMSGAEMKDLQEKLSSVLKSYQAEISEFVQRLIVKIAILEASANSV